MERIKLNKPSETALPQPFFSKEAPQELLAAFSAVIHAIGGVCTTVHDDASLNDVLFGNGQQLAGVVNAVPESSLYNVQEYILATAKALENTKVFVAKGSIAVAENGAVWISERNMGNRLLPFLCEQLIIIVEAHNIVANMHEAYEKIAINENGYGAFIAGPSKTADIEQSLVVGAHGPLRLEVFVMTNKSKIA